MNLFIACLDQFYYLNVFLSKADDPFIIYCIGFHLVVGLIYWTGGLVYTLFDLYNPHWLQKYKLQPGKNQPVDKNDLIMVKS